MRIMLDRREYDMNADSVGEAIAACAAVAEREGRMIVEVVVDGARWTTEQIESPDLVNETAEEVELTTADPRMLLNVMFGDAAEALDGAAALQAEAAALLQADERGAGLARLHESLHIWSAVHQTVAQGAPLLDQPLDEIDVGDPATSAAMIIKGFEGQLRSVLSHIEIDDMVALADTLMYELPEAVKQWRGLLLELQRHTAGPEEKEGR